MIRSLVDGIGASVGAAAFAVLPSFIQQYTSGVSTCQIELARILGGDGLSPDVVSATQQRAAWCADAAHALDASSGIGRVAVFVQNFDPDIARATLHVFQPAVQMSLDGLYFFIAGLIFGLIVINIVAFPFRAWARRRRERLYYR
jgi:hypothetical protein